MWTSAQVGPILLVGVEQRDNALTPSVLSHSSPESIAELFVSLSAPPGIHFTIWVDDGLVGSNSLDGDGTKLFKSYAARSSGMVRVADIPHTVPIVRCPAGGHIPA